MSAEEEAELLRRAIEEREVIVKRYDIGRSARSNIDAWEDGEDSENFFRDKYGFLQLVFCYCFWCMS
jgi:hypothetical protein